MKVLVLMTLIAFSSVTYAKNSLDFLDCRTINGLSISVEKKITNKEAVAKVKMLGLSRNFTVTSVESQKNLTTVQLNSPLTSTGIVETYMVYLKGATESRVRARLSGVVTKTVINMATPIPVETVPVTVKCEIEYAE